MSPPLPRTVRLRTCATSANIGPGFDAVGLALSLHNEIVVEAIAGGFKIEVTGEGAETIPTGANNLVFRAMLAGFAHIGMEPPGVAISCTNAIPLARGLGSSAAAVVGGLLVARAFAPQGSLDDSTLLNLAAGLEGHPDNVAACLFGGGTIAWREADGYRAHRFTPTPELVATAFIPSLEVQTSRARAALPAVVPHADAAENAGRAALLVPALTHAPQLLAAATQDWLHQRYRAESMPQSAALISALRAAGGAAVLSGAGPTVLVLGPVPDVAAAGFNRIDLGIVTKGAVS